MPVNTQMPMAWGSSEHILYTYEGALNCRIKLWLMLQCPLDYQSVEN